MLTVKSQPDYDISHTFNILLYFLTARWRDFDHKAEKAGEMGKCDFSASFVWEVYTVDLFGHDFVCLSATVEGLSSFVGWSFDQKMASMISLFAQPKNQRYSKYTVYS